MKKITLLLSVAMALVTLCNAQSFTNASASLPGEFNSGGCTAVTDMNGDGYDDILTLDQSQFVKCYYQNLGGVPGFTLKEFGQVSQQNQWGMAVADLNNDGHKDVFSGGNDDGVFYCKIIDPDTFEEIELVVEDEENNNGAMFMQCANIADINNDGWLDTFGCDDDAQSKIWLNDASGNLILANETIDMASTPESDDSGNYGSLWTDLDNDNDLDLFIAKCRQFVDNPFDPRRINVAFMNDGENNYSDEANERGLVIYEQTWTTDFADIDNDGDFDCLMTNHSTSMRLFENDGKGFFTDITAGSGLQVDGFFLQAKLADFDNDGFVDLLTSGGDNGSQGFYRNNGDSTFDQVNLNSLIPNNDLLHSFGIGDLDKNGWLDIYASYGDTYVNPDFQHPDELWLNDGGANNWIGFDLDGTVSNLDAIGAKVLIYGDFGVQVREVRAGESYGITCSNLVHFGIGSATEVDYAVIKWPSGLVTVIEDAAPNLYHYREEADCNAPEVTVSATEVLVCQGQTAEVSVNGTGTVLWSNGMAGNSIEVGQGNYSAVLIGEGGCASLSATICVLEEEEVATELNLEGDIELCEGSSVTLEAPLANGYSWSTEETTQFIEVTESGEYFVTMEGACLEEVQSNTVSVTMLEAPTSLPISTDVMEEAGSVELSATGTDVVWFSDENGEDEIGEGSPITINVTESTTVYVANQIIHGDIIEANGGKESTSEPGAHHNNSENGLVFSAFEDMVIRDVKVFANGDGDRTIVLENSFGQIIETKTVNIPDGESVVDLDFSVPMGNDYVLITTGNPQLWRDAVGSGVDYPYELGSLGSITGSTVNGMNEFTYYYFFYDWNVETPSTSCYSDLVPVEITITGIDELESISSFEIFPNPATTEIRYEYTTIASGTLLIEISDFRGRSVYTNRLDKQNGNHSGVINLSDYAPGVYTFTLIENDKRASQKIVIE